MTQDFLEAISIRGYVCTNNPAFLLTYLEMKTYSCWILQVKFKGWDRVSYLRSVVADKG
jgi:hypothetical protein